MRSALICAFVAFAISNLGVNANIDPDIHPMAGLSSLDCQRGQVLATPKRGPPELDTMTKVFAVVGERQKPWRTKRRLLCYNYLRAILILKRRGRNSSALRKSRSDSIRISMLKEVYGR